MTRKEYQLIDVNEEGYATLMSTETGETNDSLKFPPDAAREDPAEMAKYAGLLAAVRAAEKDVFVTVLTALGTEMILSQGQER